MKVKCKSCTKEFNVPPSKTKLGKGKFCSNPCRMEAHRKKWAQKRLDKLLGFKKNGFKEHIGMYEHLLESDPTSPNGRVFIGKAIKPLMESDTGHGYQGILLQDETRELIKCHGCGVWNTRLGYSHIKKCLGISVVEYKDRFGLNRTQGLVSDAAALRLQIQMIKNSGIKKHQFKRGKSYRKGGAYYASVQQQNDKGTCEKQLGEQLAEFIISNREFPHRRNRGKPLYSQLKRRYGTFQDALEFYGFPKFKQRGPHKEVYFEVGKSEFFNTRKIDERELMFEKIINYYLTHKK